jgi:hypothetical protein
MWCGNVEKVHPLMEKLCFFEVVRGLMVFTQWEVMAWSFILRCLRQLSGGKSDTLSVQVCLCGIGDCTVSSVEGEEPPGAASRYLDPQGRSPTNASEILRISLDTQFSGRTLLCYGQIFRLAALETPFVLPFVSPQLTFFSSFFLVRNILVSDSSGSAGSPVLPTYRP